MLRRPKAHFKPKISTGPSDNKQVSKTQVKQSVNTVEVIQCDPVSDVSNCVAIETTEDLSNSNDVSSSDTTVRVSNTLIIEPREVPVISIPSSQDSCHSSSRKRTRASGTTIEVVNDSDNPFETPNKQLASQPRYNTPRQSGLSSRKKPKICLSSSKQNLPLDRSKVTMFDLLSYNPPLSEEQKEKKKKEREDALSGSDLEEERSSVAGSPFKVPPPVKSKETHNQQPSASQQSSGGESESSCESFSEKTVAKGPRVKIGADGNIVIDEESLIVRRAEIVINESNVINEGKVGLSSTNYESFRKRKTTRNRWTEDETVKFYHALSAIGTDFTLMADTFFRNLRTREELRNKFKKEEKTKSDLIDKALAQTNLKYATDYLEKINKKSSPTKSPEKSTPIKTIRQTSPTRKSPRST